MTPSDGHAGDQGPQGSQKVPVKDLVRGRQVLVAYMERVKILGVGGRGYPGPKYSGRILLRFCAFQTNLRTQLFSDFFQKNSAKFTNLN